MKRLVAALVVFAVLALLSTLASAERTPRIGYLTLESIRDTPSRERKAFLDDLVEFGHVPGKSVEVIYRSAESEPEFLSAMCEELLSQKVDVVTTLGELPTRACLEVTRTVPIVFVGVGDPIGIQAAESLARPGGNATGVSYTLVDLAAKRIELLKLAVPDADRIAFLWDARSRVARLEAAAAQSAARKGGAETIPMPVESQTGLNERFKQIATDRPDALYVGFTPGVIARNRTAIAEFALEQRLAVVSAWAYMTEAGGLMSYSPDNVAVVRRGAYYVHRILDGTPPSELPIEQIGKIELVINQGTARRLGLRLPSELMLRANRVIE